MIRPQQLNGALVAGSRRRRALKKSELLARVIVREIARTRSRPGDVLAAEAVMLEHYGVGRATLREALRLLETQGLVRLRPGPGGGPVVGEADAMNLGRTASLYFAFAGATYGDLGEALMVVDPWLAELAAERTDRDVVEEALQPFLDDPGGPAAPEERTRYLNDYHQVIRRLSGNAVVSIWGQVVGNLYSDHVEAEVDFTTIHPLVMDEHTQIARAIISGKGAKARALMYAHSVRIVDYCNSAVPAVAGQPIEWR